MAKEEKKLVSCLRDDKVQIKFIPKLSGNNTDDKSHVAYGGMLNEAYIKLGVKRLKDGSLVNVLTTDEKEYLEDHLELNLSIYNKDFWRKQSIRLTKEGLTLDLKNPYDYIKYKILATNTDLISPGYLERFNKRSYKFFIASKGDEQQAKRKNRSITREAFKLQGKYEDDAVILKYALKQLYKYTSKDATAEKMSEVLDKLIETKAEDVVHVLSDKNLKLKAKINQAVDLGVLKVYKKEYKDPDGAPLCHSGEKATLDNVADFLNEPANQEVKFSIEGRINQKLK